MSRSRAGVARAIPSSRQARQPLRSSPVTPEFAAVMPGLALIFALCLALIDLGASRFALARAEPRSRWLSLAGGASVAYVFVGHLLPELKKGQDVIVRADLPLEFLEHHAYIVALLGFITFYGLERLAVRSRRRNQVLRGEDATTPMVSPDSHPFLCLL